MEQSIFIVKSYCEMESYNPVHTKFRTLFPELLPPNKTTVWKRWHMNKEGSGRRITARIQESIKVAWQALKINQEIISPRKNGSGILPSSFCQRLALLTIQNDQVPQSTKWWLWQTLSVVSASVQQSNILSKLCKWWQNRICFKWRSE